jgi:UDP-GlcNAc:undecaprenyl-phosphate GlcNAc-1-phosphate transferase
MIYFFIFIIPFMAVYLSTPNVRYVALRLSIIDRRNHRKIHKKLISKLGGLAIYFGLLGALIIIILFDMPFFKEHILEMGGLMICSTLILMLGIYDDFNGSNALTKFLIQATLAFLLVKTGFVLERIFIPGLLDLHLGRLSVPVTVLWIVGITNAINLIDGLDGLAAGLVAIISLFFCIHSFLLGDKFVIFIALALAGANLSFLKYNFYPAKIFMGDTGSLFLGFIIAALAVYSPRSEGFSNPFFIPACIVLILPIADTFAAIVRRRLRGRDIFKGDSSHIHHYYIKLGFGHAETVKRFYVMTILLGLASLSVVYAYLNF